MKKLSKYCSLVEVNNITKNHTDLPDIGFLNSSLVSSSVDTSEVELFDREPFEDEELLGS